MALKPLGPRGSILIEIYWHSNYIYWLFEMFEVSCIYANTLYMFCLNAACCRHCHWNHLWRLECQVTFAPCIILISYCVNSYFCLCVSTTLMVVVIYYEALRLRWSRGSVLAFGTQVREFKPGRSRWIFQGEKILSTTSFGREVKPFVPSHIFAACKRTRKFMRGSRSFRSKLPAISRPSSSSFHY